MVNLMKGSLLIAVAILMTGLASCRQDMQDQPKYLAYRGSESFADSLSSRALVEGTVARGYLRADQACYTGKSGAAPAKGDTSKGEEYAVDTRPVTDVRPGPRETRQVYQPRWFSERDPLASMTLRSLSTSARSGPSPSILDAPPSGYDGGPRRQIGRAHV